ncbi:YutD family protein [Bhargavaea cecembensis]|uniref:YutD family protein n=1 Tax=Bhargavaea cecembensis TaxID=394098 RepID=UPI00058F1818|nr:YutD family protein [Bhargavaea cecembensis]
MIRLEQNEYEILEDYRDGFQEEAVNDRYSEILSKYDYIVGDWGYGQLRLRGFFDDRNPKATVGTKISTLQDYLFEHCNFGCAYFVLKKTGRQKGNTRRPAEPDAAQEDEDPQDGE